MLVLGHFTRDRPRGHLPYLLSPEPRHRGRAERTIDRDGQRVIVGVVYDPSRVAPAKLDAELSEELEATLRQAALRPDRRWFPWEAVARLEARYPGDVLPHPGLDLPVRLRYPRWHEGEAERALRLERERRQAKTREMVEGMRR